MAEVYTKGQPAKEMLLNHSVKKIGLWQPEAYMENDQLKELI